jgi:dinuclear metal center YbgI/SA1388 family protein
MLPPTVTEHIRAPDALPVFPKVDLAYNALNGRDDMKLSTITAWLDELLHSAPIPDVALNGLQFGSEREVERIGLAVDARMATFQAAIEADCQLLLVHHGLYWGAPFPITGAEYERMNLLWKNGLSLYASHLPLDVHPEVGNNAGLLRCLGLSCEGTFGDYKGVALGFYGDAKAPRAPAAWSSDLEAGLGGPVKLLDFGPAEAVRVGAISGAMPGGDAMAALRVGVDLLITGEHNHQLHALAEDWGISLAFGGHYATECLGVKAVGERLTSELGISTVFLPNPTGM